MRTRLKSEYAGLTPAPADKQGFDTYTAYESSATASPSTSPAKQAAPPDSEKAHLSPDQLVVLLDHVSKGGMEDRGVWNTYAEMVKGPLLAMSPGQVCSVIRSFTRVGFVKHSLLNQAVRQIAKSQDLSSRQVGGKGAFRQDRGMPLCAPEIRSTFVVCRIRLHNSCQIWQS